MNVSVSRLAVAVCAAGALSFAGCERLFDKGSKSDIEKGDKAASAGDYQAAVRLYEASLDGTGKTAEVHYKLALIYSDKLKSPLDAMHHFDRYIAVAPNGSHVKDAKELKKQDQQRLIVSLTKDLPLSQEEVVRLKNDNLTLRKSLAELRAMKSATPPPNAGGKRGEVVQKPIPTGARTHIVQPGETLASIATKYYKSKARWKDIQDANFYSLEGTAKIKPGMSLYIP